MKKPDENSTLKRCYQRPTAKEDFSNPEKAEYGLQYDYSSSDPAFYAAKTYKSTPSDCTRFFLGTAYQWQLMMTSMGSFENLCTAFSAVGGTNMRTDLGYWVSTEYDDDTAWYFSGSQTGLWSHFSKNYTCLVRPILAF